MPYIAFDLDALEEVPNVARSIQIEEDRIAGGLLRMWRHCWRTETDTVTRERLLGFFGCDVSEALLAFGFLEPVPGGFRVRGADRYLRLQAARSAGGHAAKSNLKKGASRSLAGATPPAASRLQPELKPGSSAGCVPALTASSEQHLKASPAGAHTRSKTEATSAPLLTVPASAGANSPAPQVAAPQSRKMPGKGPGASASEREPTTPLRDLMDAAWLEKHGKAFVWRHVDELALHPVLALAQGDEAEVMRRWRHAVAWEGFPQCGAVKDLVTHWNVYGKEPLRPAGRGRASGADRDWSKTQPTVMTKYGPQLDLDGDP